MIEIRSLAAADASLIAATFSAIGWDKPEQQYNNYFQEQTEGKRNVLCAWSSEKFAGYVTIVWESHISFFKERNIPEIVDLNVLPQFRGQGIANKLMDEAEGLCLGKSPVIGIGVGLYADYGAAQKLYIKRGYIPLGNGLFYDGKPVPRQTSCLLDDSLVLFLTKPEIKI